MVVRMETEETGGGGGKEVSGGEVVTTETGTLCFGDGRGVGSL